MIYYQGVAMTDGLNRKNHFFPFSTVVKSYHDVWNKPMPMNLGHDRSKPIGFTKLSGIYIELGKAYVTNEACTTENKEEMEQLKPLRGAAMVSRAPYLHRKTGAVQLIHPGFFL